MANSDNQHLALQPDASVVDSKLHFIWSSLTTKDCSVLGELLTSGSHDSLVGLLPAFAKLANRSREIVEVGEEWVVRQIRNS